MDDPQPNTPADPQAPLAAQPVVEQPVAAVPGSEPATPPTDPQAPADPEPATPATSPDDDAELADYWTKKGIDITTPEGQAQAAKSYREAEKAMHSKNQAASELEKQLNAQPLEVNTDNELVKQALQESSQLKTTLAVRDWKSRNNITPEQDIALGEYVTKTPDIGYLLKNDVLTLDQVYAMSGVGTLDADALKKAGGEEALQRLASTQRSSAPKGSASHQAPTPDEDPILAVLLAD
jgi:hypothetical protein